MTNHAIPALSCVQQRRARSTGTRVSVWRPGVWEDDPSAAWTTICEDHGYVVGHRTRALAIAWAAEPESWCEDCSTEAR